MKMEQLALGRIGDELRVMRESHGIPLQPRRV